MGNQIHLRKNHVQQGEPSRRGISNRQNGLAAELAFLKTHPGAKRDPHGAHGDFIYRGRRYEVKYGTSPATGPQRGATVVRYYRKGGKLVRITEDDARLLKNAKSRASWADRKARGRPR